MAESPGRPQAASNIYTILLIIATAFAVIGTVFVSVRADEFFGSWVPQNLIP